MWTADPSRRGNSYFPLCWCLLLGLGAVAAHAADDEPGRTAAAEPYAIHLQATFVEQGVPDFNSPYTGRNSLTPGQNQETSDFTLYLGTRLWRDAQLWADGEFDQGFGLNNTVGLAGFPSGEAYKIGRNQPYFKLQRLFLHQMVSLGGGTSRLESAANQLAGMQSANRVEITAGKFSVTDVFDVSQYAHDPRADFLNWGAIDAGTFDYAADAWGYTVGTAAEWYQGDWTARAGLFDLSRVPNSEHLQSGLHELQGVVEVEHRHQLGGKAGKLMVTAFDTHARMASLADAVALALQNGVPPDLSALRHMRSRLGAHLTVEQQLTDQSGVFLRAGGAAGNVETYEFTDIDQSLAAGLSLKGANWSRPADTVGVALMRNQISGDRQRWLAVGGLGILVGDGKLPHPAPERVFETYYSIGVLQSVQLTLDYQFVLDPAYNADRGPVSIMSARLHWQL